MSAGDIFGGGVAVITGAGAGIGAGLARHASALGMTVVIADVDGDAADTLAEELSAAGGQAVPTACDVRDPDAVTALAERTYRDIGPVRLLVNNAGVEQFGYLWDTPVANWNRVVDVNISGVFHGIRAFLPRMIDAGTPTWVWNLSSIGGVAVVPLAVAVHHEQARRTGANRMPAAGSAARRTRPHPRAGRVAGRGGLQHLRIRGQCRHRRR